MLLSGFSMARNADKLYFPIGPSVASALPIVDEFVVALGRGDTDDRTEEILRGLHSPKLRIIPREWDEKLYRDGHIFAHETTFALNETQGAWALYLQADEVLHEREAPLIRQACEQYLHDEDVEGMLLQYYHFWGDYEHVVDTHCICRVEVRVVRNGIGAYSYKDAISFRRADNRKLRVVELPVHVYHYGYVRDPALMGRKKRVQDALHQGIHVEDQAARDYDYGPIEEAAPFAVSRHPAVMRDFIERLHWKDALQYRKRRPGEVVAHRWMQPKYQMLSALERRFNGNRVWFGWKNHELLKGRRYRFAPRLAYAQPA